MPVEAWLAAQNAGAEPLAGFLTLGVSAQAALRDASPASDPEFIALRCDRLVALELALWFRHAAAHASASPDSRERVRGLYCHVAAQNLSDTLRPR
jgi:hypothetical protein